jgi:hypothetical protein
VPDQRLSQVNRVAHRLPFIAAPAGGADNGTLSPEG